MATYPEIKAGLLKDFSGRNEDATQWLLAMKAYFIMNLTVYTDEKTRLLIMLNKMSKGEEPLSQKDGT